MSKRPIAASLQQKVSLALLGLMAGLAALSYFVLDTTIVPAFDNLEIAAAETNLIRAQRSIEAELANVAGVTSDWAYWDDTYDFVKGQNPDFEGSNLTTATMLNLHLDLIVFYGIENDMRWGRLLSDGEPDDINKLGIFGVGTRSADKLLDHESLTSRLAVLVRSDLGPMLISSIPILTSSEEGPIAGTMIIGRFLNENLTAELRARTEVDFSLHPITDNNLALPLKAQQVVDEKVSGDMHETTDSKISSYTLLRDLLDEPLLVLQADMPRQISALGHRTIRGASVMLTIIGVIVAFATWLLLRSVIVRPLESIAGHITEMRDSGDLTRNIGEDRDDEIGLVAHEFDKMTAEVNEARQLLLDQSYKAGKADTAAEVLHNIRNAMTPLINGIDRLNDYFGATGKLRMKDAVEQLRSADCPPDRREKLIQYIDSAFEQVEAVGSDAIDGVKQVSTHARQVESILADQERHANVSPVFENLELDGVVDEAALVIPDSQEMAIELHVGEDLGRFRVYAHRVGLLQVLGNIILNGYESIVRSGSPKGVIQVSAATEAVDDKEMIRLTVSDSGCGFDFQTHEKIFQRGYLSKERGLSGLGLHWCANALARMGGRIRAESSGVGNGADFHVLLPAAQGG